MPINVDERDDEDPFEVDDQLAHLFKHEGLGFEDVLDVWSDRPVFYPAKHPPAELLMVGEVPGDVLMVPITPAEYAGPTKVRPIGVYRAHDELVRQYRTEP